ncbi:MAG TPA: Gfo/Idh/MocA family oxidoreductase [Flavisolibacter sp.]|jgi:predicted dehydrogenase|nr:Gfo/Idh/MocA family oxidoreductase [Flavisolibacter sp.]
MQQINTAILSFGMSGKLFHAPFLHVHEGFRFYAVLERSKNLAQEVYPDVKTYRNLEDLLADETIELVIVNTPNYTHYDYAKKALEAGKHVIVEKPFVVNAAEGEELIQLAQQKGLLLSPYQNRRWDSDFKTVQKIVEEGWLGNIVEAEFHFDRYKEELSPKQHKEVPGPGTGALYDLGAHIIDQALLLFGEPEAVFGDIRIVRPVSKVDDYFEVLLYYPQLRVRLHGSYLVREPLPSYILHGAKGSFLKWRADVQEAALLEGKTPGTPDWGVEPVTERGLLHTEKDGAVIRETVPTVSGNYLHYFEGIYEAVRNGAALPITGQQAINTIRVIEAAFRSSEEKKVVAFCK